MTGKEEDDWKLKASPDSSEEGKCLFCDAIADDEFCDKICERGYKADN